MTKINMRALNKKWRKLTGARTTKGIKLQRKLNDVISLMGHEIPWDKTEKVILANSLTRGPQPKIVSKVSDCAPVHSKKSIKSGSRKAKSNAFYASWEWKQVRYESLQIHGRQCMCCGWSPSPGSKGKLCVDHIKPRSKFPELALEVSNTQVLCNDCNMGKSNIYEDDFRSEWHGEEEDETDPLTAQFNATMQ